MKKILGVIPYRLQSSRIPQKIFEKIGNDELCVRTLKQTLKVGLSDFTLIAAVDDEKAKNLLSKYLPDNQIILTDPALPSGTDRVYTAAKIYAAQSNIRFQALQAVVNIQGDMPFLSPTALEKFLIQANSWDQNEERILTPYEAWPEDMDFKDLGNVKIACDATERALYFSRFPIPCSRELDVKMLKLHVGVYAYTPSALEKFCRSDVSQLEKLEGLEQLRAMNVGIPIHCMKVECQKGESFRGIDTPGDLNWARTFVQP